MGEETVMRGGGGGDCNGRGWGRRLMGGGGRGDCNGRGWGGRL